MFGCSSATFIPDVSLFQCLETAVELEMYHYFVLSVAFDVCVLKTNGRFWPLPAAPKSLKLKQTYFLVLKHYYCLKFLKKQTRQKHYPLQDVEAENKK